MLKSRLFLGDLRGFRAFIAVNHFELHILAFSKGLETFAEDVFVMHEEVFAPVIRSNEPVTFLVVEPLYFTFCHVFIYFLI